jgi:excisionase family DNA binding protein
MDIHYSPSAVTALDELRSGPPTLSIEQAAQYLGVSRAYGYEMARAGRLPTIQLGARRVRVPALALLKMLGGE